MPPKKNPPSDKEAFPGSADSLSVGSVLHSHEAQKEEFTIRLQENGAEGYIALGSILVSILETKKFPELQSYIMDLSSETREQVSSHAAAIFRQSASAAIVAAIEQEKKSLWIQACDGGIRSTLDGYRVAANSDIESSISRLDEFSKQLSHSTSFGNIVKTSVVSGIVLGIFLLILGLIDNPLADIFATFSVK
jgi:hypothetical protein